jgi:ribosome-associated toxin RatA of RatAB toxin-antitoxin module
MQTENTVEMAGDLDHIVALAADVERWPEILPHYRWVTLLEGGGDRKTVEMAARRGRIPVKWRAIQEIERDGTTPVIRYRHIWGVTKGMDVAWTFDPAPGAVKVRIDHDYTPAWPVIGRLIGPPIADHIIGPQFVGAIAGKTLQTIKAIVENRDSRFNPDGSIRT